MKKTSKITIIGGGVNGLCSAYYLQASGYEVEIIDASFDGDGSSYGNAGMVVPSHFIPMASPGIISKGLKWMFDSASPFYIRPRLDLRLIEWLWKFKRSCTVKNVEESQELIWQYNEMSKSEYKFLSETEEDLKFDFQERGLMMLYKSEKSQKEEIEIAHRAQDLGVKTEILNNDQVQALNPNTKVDVLGGVYYPGDAHLYSNLFMQQMKALLKTRGVAFVKGRVSNLSKSGKQINSIDLESGDTILTDYVVVTAGTWSWKLLKSVGAKLLIEDGKGYSVTQKNIDLKPSIPSILTDEKVAITPMGRDLRVTGTLEISGISPVINRKRVDGFLNAVPKYFPEMKVDESDRNGKIWTGYRPLSFDGIPYLGHVADFDNLIVASGHGMMGMSLGPATGKLVAEMIKDEKTSINVDLMNPSR